MPTVSRRALRALAIAVLCLPLGVLPASAGAPEPGQVLEPPPPDIYTCTPYGAGTVCHAHRDDVLDPEPTGLWCDGPHGSFEIWDQAARAVDFTRWYDRDGLIVARLVINTFSDAWLSNPLTGAEVSYRQRDRDMEQFAVPGDLDSGTLASTGSITAVVPGLGAVLVEHGRWVVRGEEVVQSTGRRDLTDAFAGDPDALDAVCDALAG
jgi:hypothetical protein